MNEQALEQVLKRLQDTMSLFSTVLEQLEELQWVVKDTIEDLVLALNDDSFISKKKEEREKPSEVRASERGSLALGPGNAEEGVST